VSLDEVADELDISQQALSQRLVYALDTLIEETIGVGPSP
jgi:predicted DNA binding protein